MDLADEMVPLSSFPQSFLQGRLRSGMVHFGGAHISLESVLFTIEEVIRGKYEDIANSSPYSSHFEDNEPDDWHRLSGYILPPIRSEYTSREILEQEGLEVTDYDLYNTIADALPDCTWVVKDPWGQMFHEAVRSQWEEYLTICKRAFDKGISVAALAQSITANKLFDTLFGELGHLGININQGTPLYRCLPYPNREIRSLDWYVSPPDAIAGMNRFNLQGKGMLYVSLDPLTPLSEVGGGNPCHLATLAPNRTIRVFNLTRISRHISIFDDSNWDDMLALRHLNQSLTQSAPTEPAAKALLYYPTQVFTAVMRLQYPTVEGLLYSSAKDDAVNAVLFHGHNDCQQLYQLLNVNIHS